MKILFVSHSFAPAVGGLESISMMLARGFAERGHEVCLVTQTTGELEYSLPFSIVRRPSAIRMLELTYWCEVMFHNNISLRVAWPLLFIRRPWVVAHHTWIPQVGGLRGFKGRIKSRLLKHAKCIAISQSIASLLNYPSVIIPNAYDDKLFRQLPEVDKSDDLVFVGRLVSDKGVDILLHALHKMKTEYHHLPMLAIIGEGPEEQELRRLATELGLDSSVRFAGRMQGEDLVREINAHSVMVVPSRWNEPFGIVALEGVACGCVVIASAGGGLPDAVGPCGVTFPNGDSDALAGCIIDLLEHPDRVQELKQHADQHLACHAGEQVVSGYLRVITDAVAAQ